MRKPPLYASCIPAPFPACFFARFPLLLFPLVFPLLLFSLAFFAENRMPENEKARKISVLSFIPPHFPPSVRRPVTRIRNPDENENGYSEFLFFP